MGVDGGSLLLYRWRRVYTQHETSGTDFSVFARVFCGNAMKSRYSESNGAKPSVFPATLFEFSADNSRFSKAKCLLYSTGNFKPFFPPTRGLSIGRLNTVYAYKLLEFYTFISISTNSFYVATQEIQKTAFDNRRRYYVTKDQCSVPENVHY